MTEGSITPTLSVIVPVPDRFETVATTVASLAAQDIRGEMELVFVTPVPELAVEPARRAGFGGTQVVVVSTDLWRSTARSRAAGIRAARAPLVALVEDHCFPTPGWAAALVRAHQQPWAGVGPVILNANPATTVSWANLAVEYGPWLAPRDRGPAAHIPGHNSSYKREVLLAYGDALDELMEAESVLQWDLQRRGHQVALEPDARSRHQNFARFLPSITLRFHGGRLFAANRASTWPVARRLLYAAGSPLLPFVRTSRAMRDLRRAAARRAGVATMATTFTLLVFDAIGECMGYVTGRGSSLERLTDLEFHRQRFADAGPEAPAP